ncbi:MULTISPECIES: hypothetical protein [unclassified Micromonospora]|uniref:hypothetical protein n=1 Tax=unclassified Micromonospora TaxID=2617518 RepID=UPI0033A2CFDD
MANYNSRPDDCISLSDPGWVAEQFGARSTFLLGGGVSLIVGLVALTLRFKTPPLNAPPSTPPTLHQPQPTHHDDPERPATGGSSMPAERTASE